MNPKPRASEPTREDDKRPRVWEPPKKGGLLPGLQDDPNFAYRWVNKDVQGQTDLVDKALIDKLREGWEPVRPSDHPLFALPEYQRLIKNDNIVRPGQVLMRMPKYMAQQRNAYWMNEDRKARSINVREKVQSADPANWQIEEHLSKQQIVTGANAAN